MVQFIGNLDPDVKLPFLAGEKDTGPFVKALVQESPGKNLIAYREWCTMNELATAFTQATGIQAETVVLPKGESHIPAPPDVAIQSGEMWAYCNEFGYEGRADPTLIHPKNVS